MTSARLLFLFKKLRLESIHRNYFHFFKILKYSRNLVVALEKQASVEPEFPYALRYTVISNTLKGIQIRNIKKSWKALNDGAFQNSIIGYLRKFSMSCSFFSTKFAYFYRNWCWSISFPRWNFKKCWSSLPSYSVSVSC